MEQSRPHWSGMTSLADVCPRPWRTLSESNRPSAFFVEVVIAESVAKQPPLASTRVPARSLIRFLVRTKVSIYFGILFGRKIVDSVRS